MADLAQIFGELARLRPTANLDLQSEDVGPPRLLGEVSVPFMGGDLGLKGNYWRPAPQAPPDYSLQLGYRRQF